MNRYCRGIILCVFLTFGVMEGQERPQFTSQEWGEKGRKLDKGGGEFLHLRCFS
jgi:hypothetical protein